MGPLSLFALAGSHELGQRVAEALGLPCSEHEEREFEDGEHKARPLVGVRGHDVYVLHSLHGDPRHSPNDKLCRLLFFAGALRDAGAARVTAVVPYLCYARKERKTKSRDPVTTRYVAGMFEAVGVDRVVAMDVHDLAAFQNAFRCRTEHLEARPLFVRHAIDWLAGDEPVVVSPDPGGVKRAAAFERSLERALGREVGSAFMEKGRSGGVVRGEALVGQVRDRAAIVVDDLIAAGTTLARAAAACRARGARRVLGIATHGLFVGGGERCFGEAGLDRIAVTDTVPPFRVAEQDRTRKLSLLEAGPLLAEAIGRLHDDRSLVELSEP